MVSRDVPFLHGLKDTLVLCRLTWVCVVVPRNVICRLGDFSCHHEILAGEELIALISGHRLAALRVPNAASIRAQALTYMAGSSILATFFSIP
jgi:hypothetical protein